MSQRVEVCLGQARTCPEADGGGGRAGQIVGVNSQHVVQDLGSDCAGTGCTLLDGFTITGGRAFLGDESVKSGQGGGLWSQGGSSTLRNLIIQGNQAYRGGGFFQDGGDHNIVIFDFVNNWARSGGGMAVVGEAHFWTPDRVTFQGNQAKLFGSSDPDSANGGGMYFASTFSNAPINSIGLNFLDNTADSSGGGLYTTRPFDFDVQLRLEGATFRGNKAAQYGGAMANEDSSLYVDLSTFQGNEASEGGAISNRNGSNMVLFDSLISGNFAQLNGGGMLNDASSPELTNVTFSGNRATDNGQAMLNRSGSNALIRNSIMWQTGSPPILNSASTPLVSYSLLEGCGPSGFFDPNCGSDGGGNIEPNDPSDPVFVAPIDPATAPSTAGDFRLDINSPAIDVGNNAYNDHYAALGGVENPNTPIVRTGPLLAYVFFDDPNTAFNKPAILLILNWNIKHRFRTGRDVSAAVPYVVLGFKFEGTLWTAE